MRIFLQSFAAAFLLSVFSVISWNKEITIKKADQPFIGCIIKILSLFSMIGMLFTVFLIYSIIKAHV